MSAHAFEPVHMQPLNLLPLFEALGIPPPPPLAIPPMPAEHPDLVHEEEEEDEGLDEDWTTVYQDGPEHPAYTDEDIPGALVNVVQEGFTFLELARGVAGVSNTVKDTLYFGMKTMMNRLTNGLIGNLQDIDTCWQPDFTHLVLQVDAHYSEDMSDILNTHLGDFHAAFLTFVQWIRDTMTPHGLAEFDTLPEIYYHYVRHMLRPLPQIQAQHNAFFDAFLNAGPLDPILALPLVQEEQEEQPQPQPQPQEEAQPEAQAQAQVQEQMLG